MSVWGEECWTDCDIILKSIRERDFWSTSKWKQREETYSLRTSSWMSQGGVRWLELDEVSGVGWITLVMNGTFKIKGAPNFVDNQFSRTICHHIAPKSWAIVYRNIWRIQIWAVSRYASWKYENNFVISGGEHAARRCGYFGQILGRCRDPAFGSDYRVARQTLDSSCWRNADVHFCGRRLVYIVICL